MKKRSLLVISGTVMGTVGVLSYVPSATNAMAPLATSASNLTAGVQASAPVTATSAKSTSNAAQKKTAHKTTTSKAKTLKHKSKAQTSTGSSAATPSATGATRKIDGSTIQTQFGPVQVQITVQGTKIVGATALQTPQGGRSSWINQQAVPYLVQETLAAQSANIQGVSGATYTSDGWVQSLQSALAKI